ncbi:hypothetical protein GO009_17205 [Muricauda sp. TY007]|uniref:hypothetical protein n=1 Tax=Allomuricauda sp. TY007 TaxID=2683200 RepID=UPI0013BF9864|nr:hypothetical protein [Muricauda sp. TY007]NDV17755.1 hypothetical protein [Muricauda sp. TY007]
MSHSACITADAPEHKPVIGNKMYHCTSTIAVDSVQKTYGFDVLLEYSENFFSWKKSNFTINGKTSFEKADRLYLHLTSPLNTIELGCKEGKVTALYQKKEITKEWERTKAKLQSEYSGKVAEQLIEAYDRHYSSPGKLIQFLQADGVFQLFYRGFLNNHLVYQGFSSGIQHQLFGFSGVEPITILGNKTLQMEGTDLKLQYLATTQNTKDDPLDITVDDNFILDPKSTWIKKATATIHNKTNNSRTTITLKSKQPWRRTR